MVSGRRERWGLVLAGGDGLRLRSLTRRLVRDERPKQFCPVLGPTTLLEETQRRVALAIPRDLTLTIVTRTRERFYRPLLADAVPWSVIVQPGNRGTAPALLYALLRLVPRTPMAPVAVFPCDHFLSDEPRAAPAPSAAASPSAPTHPLPEERSAHADRRPQYTGTAARLPPGKHRRGPLPVASSEVVRADDRP